MARDTELSHRHSGTTLGTEGLLEVRINKLYIAPGYLAVHLEPFRAWASSHVYVVCPRVCTYII